MSCVAGSCLFLKKASCHVSDGGVSVSVGDLGDLNPGGVSGGGLSGSAHDHLPSSFQAGGLGKSPPIAAADGLCIGGGRLGDGPGWAYLREVFGPRYVFLAPPMARRMADISFVPLGMEDTLATTFARVFFCQARVFVSSSFIVSLWCAQSGPPLDHVSWTKAFARLAGRFLGKSGWRTKESDKFASHVASVWAASSPDPSRFAGTSLTKMGWA